MPFRTLRTAVLLAGLVPAAGLAGEEPLSATGSDAGIGVEFAGLSRSYEINGVEVSGQGAVGGVHAFLQWGAWFRAEGRVVAGSLEYDRPDPGESGPAVLGEARATWGTATETGTRLYAGVGGRRIVGDSPFGSGDATSTLVYIPFGVASAGHLRPGWRALVTLEGQFLVAGREEIDNVAGLGDDVAFDRAGGWGVEASAHFRNAAADVGIEPFIRYMQPADSDRESVGSSNERISSVEEGSAGVRFTWTF